MKVRRSLLESRRGDVDVTVWDAMRPRCGGRHTTTECTRMWPHPCCVVGFISGV